MLLSRRRWKLFKYFPIRNRLQVPRKVPRRRFILLLFLQANKFNKLLMFNNKDCIQIIKGLTLSKTARCCLVPINLQYKSTFLLLLLLSLLRLFVLYFGFCVKVDFRDTHWLRVFFFFIVVIVLVLCLT